MFRLELITDGEITKNVNELKNFLQNRRNTATLIGLLVMVALLPLGLYLGQLQQIFFSRASGTLIQVSNGNCVTTDDEGNKALKCGTVPLVLYNPFLATPTPSPTPTPNTNGCMSDAQCSSGQTCRRYQNYPGNCLAQDINCAAIISRACNPNNPQECVDFPSPCEVPPGWTVQNSRSPAPAAPAAPTGLIATSNAINYHNNSCEQGRAEVGLSWAITTGATSYKVYRVYYGQSGFTHIGNASETNYKDVAVDKGRVAYYRVTAVNEAGESAPSSEIQVDVASCPLVACQPPPDMGRPTAIKIPGGLRVTRTAQTGTTNNTPNNLLTGFNLTGFSNVRVDFNGRTYKEAANIDLRSGGGTCIGNACTDQGPQGTKSITFDIYLINNNLGGTAFFTMVDSCRAITDFVGSSSRSQFGDGAPPPELPAPGAIIND